MNKQGVPSDRFAYIVKINKIVESRVWKKEINENSQDRSKWLEATNEKFTLLKKRGGGLIGFTFGV